MSESVHEEYVCEYWDCPKCENKGIRGDSYTCNQCGYPRDNSITFYRKDTEEVKISDEGSVDKFKKGPDWICSFCQSLNHQEDSACKGCGATREDSEKNYFDELEKRKAKEEKKKSTQSEPPPKKSYKTLSIVSAFMIGIIGFISYGSCTHKVNYNVTQKKWVRALAVERYQSRERENWRDQIVGDDVETIRSFEEIRSYEKRQVGTRTESYQESESYQSGTKNECSTSYESTGSGASKKTTKCKDVPVYSNRNVTRTREVPVYQDFPIYDTKVRYRSKMFELIGYRIKKGEGDTVQWPELNPGTGVDSRKDRSGNETESLQVYLNKSNNSDKGPDSIALELNENDYLNAYKLNSTVTLEISNFGNPDLPKGQKEFLKEEYEKTFNPIFSNELRSSD
jgi:hypothetical protein